MQILAWITTALCLFGTVLNIKKRSTCFAVWLVGNILWLIWDIVNGFASRAVLDIVQGCTCVWGIIEWNRKQEG